jgi:cell filamentation protein
MMAVLTDQDDHLKTRDYWKYLKAKLKRENRQVVIAPTQLKLLALAASKDPKSR